MKIAIVHNHPSGGAARAIYELGGQLRRRHRLDVFTLDTGDESFLPSRDYAERVRTFRYAPLRPLRGGFYLNDLGAYQNLRALERAYREIAGAVDDGRYDAVLVSACRELQAPSVLAFLATPTVYYCHEPPRRFIEPGRRRDAGPLPLYRRLRAVWHRPASAAIDRAFARRDRRNVAAARTVLTNSTFTAALVRGYYGRSADVCHLGVDAARFIPGDRRHARYVLSVGAIDRHKGFDLVIEALARIPPEERPPLVIVGNYANDAVERELRCQAAGNGVALDLRIGVPDSELARIYASARLFAYAPHLEPFGLTVLEAMAAGLPVVAIPEGGVVDSVVADRTGILVPRDARALAGAVRMLLVDEDLAGEFGREGRRLVEQEWTWQAAAQRVEDALAATAGLLAVEAGA